MMECTPDSGPCHFCAFCGNRVENYTLVIGDEKVYLRSGIKVQKEKKSMDGERIRP
jgi:hypothetical protein